MVNHTSHDRVESEFIPPSLRNVVKDYGEPFDRFGSRMDEISNEIRFIESYLTNRGVCIPYSCKVQDGHSLKILWAPYKPKSDAKERFRLLYSELQDDFDEVWLDTPLAESNPRIRYELRNEISRFFREFSEELSDRQESSPEPNIDDILF